MAIPSDIPSVLLLSSSLALATLSLFASPTESTVKTRPLSLATRLFCSIFFTMVLFLNSTKAILLKNKEIQFSTEHKYLLYKICFKYNSIMHVLHIWHQRKSHPLVGPSVPPGNLTLTALRNIFRMSSFVALNGTFFRNKHLASRFAKNQNTSPQVRTSGTKF